MAACCDIGSSRRGLLAGFLRASAEVGMDSGPGSDIVCGCEVWWMRHVREWIPVANIVSSRVLSAVVQLIGVVEWFDVVRVEASLCLQLQTALLLDEASNKAALARCPTLVLQLVLGLARIGRRTFRSAGLALIDKA